MDGLDLYGELVEEEVSQEALNSQPENLVEHVQLLQAKCAALETEVEALNAHVSRLEAERTSLLSAKDQIVDNFARLGLACRREIEKLKLRVRFLCAKNNVREPKLPSASGSLSNLKDCLNPEKPVQYSEFINYLHSGPSPEKFNRKLLEVNRPSPTKAASTQTKQNEVTEQQKVSCREPRNARQSSSPSTTATRTSRSRSSSSSSSCSSSSSSTSHSVDVSRKSTDDNRGLKKLTTPHRQQIPQLLEHRSQNPMQNRSNSGDRYAPQNRSPDKNRKRIPNVTHRPPINGRHNQDHRTLNDDRALTRRNRSINPSRSRSNDRQTECTGETLRNNLAQAHQDPPHYRNRDRENWEVRHQDTCLKYHRSLPNTKRQSRSKERKKIAALSSLDDGNGVNAHSHIAEQRVPSSNKYPLKTHRSNPRTGRKFESSGMINDNRSLPSEVKEMATGLGSSVEDQIRRRLISVVQGCVREAREHHAARRAFQSSGFDRNDIVSGKDSQGTTSASPTCKQPTALPTDKHQNRSASVKSSIEEAECTVFSKRFRSRMEGRRTLTPVSLPNSCGSNDCRIVASDIHPSEAAEEVTSTNETGILLKEPKEVVQLTSPDPTQKVAPSTSPSQEPARLSSPSSNMNEEKTEPVQSELASRGPVTPEEIAVEQPSPADMGNASPVDKVDPVVSSKQDHDSSPSKVNEGLGDPDQTWSSDESSESSSSGTPQHDEPLHLADAYDYEITVENKEEGEVADELEEEEDTEKSHRLSPSRIPATRKRSWSHTSPDSRCSQSSTLKFNRKKSKTMTQMGYARGSVSPVNRQMKVDNKQMGRHGSSKMTTQRTGPVHLWQPSSIATSSLHGSVERDRLSVRSPLTSRTRNLSPLDHDRRGSNSQLVSPLRSPSLKQTHRLNPTSSDQMFNVSGYVGRNASGERKSSLHPIGRRPTSPPHVRRSSDSKHTERGRFVRDSTHVTNPRRVLYYSSPPRLNQFHHNAKLRFDRERDNRFRRFRQSPPTLNNTHRRPLVHNRRPVQRASRAQRRF
ncbi:unnamed protein product [Calicophoron daubneyi]|uniref:Uncharacterized protein n=1 Tax=Calicophoron daubneyi TaxID=300641 RepID=A0AAV2THK8_CALDB